MLALAKKRKEALEHCRRFRNELDGIEFLYGEFSLDQVRIVGSLVLERLYGLLRSCVGA